MKNQDVSNVSGSSTVNQVRGNYIVNQGMDAGQVYSLCRSVVSAELESYKEQAETIAVQRFDDCMIKFDERLQKLEVEVRERLKEPSVQYALHTGLVECVKTSKEEKQEEILDLLIDRLKFDDDESKRYMIDQAIQTLPLLNQKQVSVLVVKYFLEVFQKVYHCNIRKRDEEKRSIIYDQIFKIFKYIKKRHSIYPFFAKHLIFFESAETFDINFLYQVRCSSESVEDNYIDRLQPPKIIYGPNDITHILRTNTILISSFKLSVLGEFIAKRIFEQNKDEVNKLYKVLQNHEYE